MFVTLDLYQIIRILLGSYKKASQGVIDIQQIEQDSLN